MKKKNMKMYFNLVQLIKKKLKILYKQQILLKINKIQKNLENYFIKKNYYQKKVNFYVVLFKKIYIQSFALLKFNLQLIERYNKLVE